MSLCIDTKSPAGLQSLLDRSDKQKDALAVSKANGIGSIPFADVLLEQTTALITSFMSGATTAAVQALSAGIEAEIKKRLGLSNVGLAQAITGITAIANAGTQGELALSAIIVNQLINQVSLRLYYYYELLYHYGQIRVILLRYKNRSANPAMARVKLSRAHVERAFLAAIKLRAKLDSLGLWDSRLYGKIFFEVDLGIKYLTADQEPDSEFFRRLKYTDRQAYLDLLRQFKRRFNKDALGQSLHLIDQLVWHTERIGTILPILASQFVTLRGITAGLERQLPGYLSTTFKPRSEELFLESYRNRTLLNSNTRRIHSQITEADKLKGLVLTNLSIDSYLESIRNLPVNWLLVRQTATALYYAMAPVQGFIGEVLDSMDNSIRQNDNAITLAVKIPLWVGELETVKQYQDLFLKSGLEQENLFKDLKVVEDIIDFVNSDATLNANDNKIPEYILSSFKPILLAPLQTTWLNEGITDTTFIIREINKAVAFNYTLLNVLYRLNVSDNPGAQAIMQFAKGLLNMPPPVNAIGQALLNGDLEAIADALGILVSTGLGAIKAFKNLIDQDCSPNINQHYINDEDSQRYYENQKTVTNHKLGQLA